MTDYSDGNWQPAPKEEKPMGDIRIDKVVYIVPFDAYKMNEVLKLMENQGLRLAHMEPQNTMQVRMVGERV